LLCGSCVMRKLSITAAVLVLITPIVLVVLSARLGPALRETAIQALGERFDSTVELASLKVSLFPQIAADGEGLVLRQKGRTDVPPLITIRRFSARSGLLALLRSPRHVGNVRLEGLEIQVRPGARPNRRLPAVDARGTGPFPYSSLMRSRPMERPCGFFPRPPAQNVRQRAL
jgi:uncharacterized protein involved in outer membrane biogenesis